MNKSHGIRSFPVPRGPNNIGVVDVMAPGPPDVSVFGRIYYPTDLKASQNRHRWVTYLEEDYIKGIFRFKRAMACRWPSWAPTKDYSCLTLMKLAIIMCPEFVYSAVVRTVMGTLYLPVVEDAPLRKWEEKYPVIVFSHGIGCSRFMYSQICCDLASFGFVVAAVEHRDGSACLSRFYDESQPEGKKMNEVEFSSVFLDDDDEYSLRNSQVRKRSEEVSRMLDFMVKINKGEEEVNNVLRAAGKAVEVFDWSSFKHQLNISKSLLIGHSFGGATTLLALTRDKRFRLGVALDAWMFPLKLEEPPASVNKPLLLLNTESFRSRENLKKQVEFAAKLTPRMLRTSVYIKDSVHLNHLDMPLAFEQGLLRKLFGMESKISPVEFLALNNNLILQFIWREIYGFSHPLVDEEIRESESRLMWGFNYDDISENIDEQEERDCEEFFQYFRLG